MDIITKTDPLRSNGSLEVILELVPTMRAALERLPGIAVHHLLVIMVE